MTYFLYRLNQKREETNHSLKVRLEKNKKAITKGEVENSVLMNHIRKEMGVHYPLWNKVQIINRLLHLGREEPEGDAIYIGLST